jgi:hypothetical protein
MLVRNVASISQICALDGPKGLNNNSRVRRGAHGWLPHHRLSAASPAGSGAGGGSNHGCRQPRTSSGAMEIQTLRARYKSKTWQRTYWQSM